MKDILERLSLSSQNESSEELVCRCFDAAEEISRLRVEIERLRIGHDRYETARLMNPRMWSVAWEINVNTGKPFDEIIDNMRPFFMGDK